MKNRYRIIVYDLEKKEVKEDREISEMLAAYVTVPDEKGEQDLYSMACGRCSIARVESMCKAVKKTASGIKKRLFKKWIKERFGGNANESN